MVVIKRHNMGHDRGMSKKKIKEEKNEPIIRTESDKCYSAVPSNQ